MKRCAILPLLAPSLVLGLVLALPCAAQDTQPAATQLASAELTAAWGDRATRHCLLCRIDRADIAHSEVHRGTLVPVCADCYDKYQADRERWFGQMLPHSALFQDEFAARRPVSWVAFGLGSYVLLGLVCAAVASGIAVRRGHPAWPLVLTSMALTVVGPLRALGLAKRPGLIPGDGLKQPATHAPVLCPHCTAPSHPAARACAACGRDLEPAIASEVEALRDA